VFIFALKILISCLIPFSSALTLPFCFMFVPFTNRVDVFPMLLDEVYLIAQDWTQETLSLHNGFYLWHSCVPLYILESVPLGTEFNCSHGSNVVILTSGMY
jgi:hypothetical protein